MGDRTWVRAEFHPDDIEKMREVDREMTYISIPKDGWPTCEGEWCLDWCLDRGNGYIEFESNEVNHGGREAFQ